jgi:demethylspheroidene O-methyltransferase
MSLSDRYFAIRNRWLSNPRFQRWAAAFPLTRRTARKRARALFDVCAGFVYSQILYACVRLKLFDLLAQGPQTAADVAVALKLSDSAAELLLEAAVSLELVERRTSGQFGLGTLGAALVGNPAVGAIIEHHRMLYSDLHDPVGLLRGEHGQTELAKYWAYSGAEVVARLPTERTAAYTDLMASSQPLVAAEIFDAYPLDKHHCLLDVGGGDGSFLLEASRRYAQLKLILFDLPAVARRASERFEAEGIGARAQALGGDFSKDSLPQGADVLSLVRVVHDHDDDAAESLLRAAHRALPPRGVLLLAEPMLGTPGAETVGPAYFGFYLLAMGHGKPRAPEELQRMLQDAGFSRSQLVRTRQPLQTRLIVAHKAATRRQVFINIDI